MTEFIKVTLTDGQAAKVEGLTRDEMANATSKEWIELSKSLGGVERRHFAYHYSANADRSVKTYYVARVQMNQLPSKAFQAAKAAA